MIMCRWDVVVLIPDVDAAKPKDAPEKKSKPSKQQECIVCKKVTHLK